MEKLSLGGVKRLAQDYRASKQTHSPQPDSPTGPNHKSTKRGDFSSLSTACPRGSLESICILHSEEQLVPVSLIPRIPLPWAGRTGLSLLVAGKAGAERDLGDSSATRLAILDTGLDSILALQILA